VRQCAYLEANLSQEIDERLTALDAKQAEVIARFKAEQTPAISETSEAIMATLETAVRTSVCETRQAIDRPPSSNVRSITEATARKTGKRERDIDKIIWPLLNSGMTVRAIAERANTSTATVGRSRKRWEANNESAMSQAANDETPSETGVVQIQEATM
jgi:DNA-binding NarL/FixJ family response regulator